jgi:hypothetical protein
MSGLLQAMRQAQELEDIAAANLGNSKIQSSGLTIADAQFEIACEFLPLLILKILLCQISASACLIQITANQQSLQQAVCVICIIVCLVRLTAKHQNK